MKTYSREEAALRLSERMRLRNTYNNKMPAQPAGTMGHAYAEWLEDQLVWSATQGPVLQRNQAVDAATKRNQTIAFLASDLSKVHGENNRLRGIVKDNKTRISTLQRRLDAERKRAVAAELELKRLKADPLQQQGQLLAAGAMVNPQERQ